MSTLVVPASHRPMGVKRTFCDRSDRLANEPKPIIPRRFSFRQVLGEEKPTPIGNLISSPYPPSRLLLLRFHVSREVVEDGLPTALLLLDRVRRFAIEDNADENALRAGHKLDFGFSLAERVFDPLVLDDLRVGAGKVKAHAAVLGLHAR
ncbi:hypothetical protein ACVWW2_006072 [Bradyrhizobium sp. LM4.3]